jgi:hypothetical protein
MLTKGRIPSLVNTMSTRRQEELSVVEGSACSCFYLTWKPPSRTMVAKVSQTTSWVLVCSLPWAQNKSWIPIGLMGCVQTHQGKPTIEGCDSSSHV